MLDEERELNEEETFDGEKEINLDDDGVDLGDDLDFGADEDDDGADFGLGENSLDD